MSRYLEILSAISRSLRTDAERIGVFRHPTAKGDGREELIRSFLAERVGREFGVSKAEIVDSDGRTSHELDAVIYEQALASCLETRPHSAVVRVEPVAVTVEVKSRLDKGEIDTTWQALVQHLRPLLRYFRPTQFLQMFKGIIPTEQEDNRVFREGLGALKDYMTIPGIVNAVFAYDGPELETALRYVQSPHVDILCVLGKYTVAQQRYGFDAMAGKNVVTFGMGDDALGGFLMAIEIAINNYREARSYVLPDSLRYLTAARTTKPVTPPP